MGMERSECLSYSTLLPAAYGGYRGTLNFPKESLRGKRNISDIIYCSCNWLKEFVAVVGRLVIEEIHCRDHGLGLAAIRNVDAVGGGVFSGGCSDIHVRPPLFWSPIKAVTQ